MNKLSLVIAAISLLASTSFANSTEKVEVQDRGETVVYTYTRTTAVSAEEVCTTIVVQVKEKKTDKVLSTDRSEYCQTLGL
ncbi:hypothetical protein D3C72_1466870 [compost metagenome]